MGSEKQTILIVDDVPENITVLDGILNQNYQIKAALNGEKALKIAQSEKMPDLILLDVMMPLLDGFEVCKKLQEGTETKKIPIIFVTAKNDSIDESKGFAIGAVDYIIKPVNPSIVKARVKSHLALKKAREELEKQNDTLRENSQLREEVELMTQHDLKNSLSAIITVPSLLIKSQNLTSRQIELLQMMKSSGYRMLEHINHSLDIFKMEKGKYNLQPVSVDLLKVIAQIQEELSALIVKRKNLIEVMVRGKAYQEKDLFCLPGEEMLFYSMLLNLIKNALEASPEREKIVIKLEDEETPQIVIHNAGEIPKIIQKSFFERYSTAGKKSGTGIGTYSAKLMAKTLNGDISFQTSHKTGTFITIKFPSALNTNETILINESETKRNKKILLVGNYNEMRQMLINILRQCGYNSLNQASNEKDALQILAAEKNDLLIVDWSIFIAKNLFDHTKKRRNESYFPILIIADKTQQENCAQMAKENNLCFIIKPFDADTLKTKVETLLAK